MLRLSSLLPTIVLGILLGANAAFAQNSWAKVDYTGKDLPNLTAEDIFALEYADEPQISPDGERVVYVRRFFDMTSDRVRGNLWEIDMSTGKQRPLTTGLANYSSPRWSNDSTRIAYIASDEEGRSQLFVRWMDTGQTAMLTHMERAPSGLAWSPRDIQIAFSMFVPDDVPSFANSPAKPKGAEWAPVPTTHEELNYRSDGRGFLKPGTTQIFLIYSAGGSMRQLTKGPFSHGGTPVWTNGGMSLLISANHREDWRHEYNDTEIFEVDMRGGDMRALTSRYGPDRSPTISPDGDWIAYTSYADENRAHQINQLWIMPREGGEPRLLLKDFDYDVEQPVWRKDGQGICFAYDIRGERRIAEVDLNGKLSQHASQVGGTSIGRPYTSGAWSVSNDGQVVYTHGEFDLPADVAAMREGFSLSRLTSLNDSLRITRKTAVYMPITWKSSHDDREIQGWLVRSRHSKFSKKLPLILEIHGGPATAYGPTFSAEIQLYAAAGYAVLYCNPRGSTSYGEEFADAIYQSYPGHDYDDLMSGVDYVLERGLADPEQLFVTGGSGGGLLSAWIVTQTDRFAAAAIAKPVINWYSFALTSDVGMGFMKRYFPGAPWDHAEQYLARSPIHFVDQVTTPSMLITGEVDWRTPMSESEQFYQALKSLDVDAALIRIPEASHGIAARPSHMIGKVNHILAWFERYRTEG
jgi:dipeptidyl aminopeptidase/acylaminoacyl peptidase